MWSLKCYGYGKTQSSVRMMTEEESNISYWRCQQQSEKKKEKDSEKENMASA